MNEAERYDKFINFETVDHPPMWLPGAPFEITRQRWEKEGLPAGVDLAEYFEIDQPPCHHLGIDTLLVPKFEEEILEQNDEFIVKIDHNGVKCRNFLDETSMSEHLEYPIKGPEDISWLKERLSVDAPGRIETDWLEKAETLRKNGGMTFLNGGMYFGFLNEHMGTEMFMMAYFDNPEFVHQVNELLCSLCEFGLKTALPHFVPDAMGYHEDMAYKNGSMISPDMFREFMTPYYKRVTALTEPHNISDHRMDSDGDIRELIPLWLECGINHFTPLEVAAGMDVVALRAEYGQTIKMSGGFDKRILSSSKDLIKKEFERLIPVIDGGGYMVACDHMVPHNVPFENYAYLIELMKVHFGVK